MTLFKVFFFLLILHPLKNIIQANFVLLLLSVCLCHIMTSFENLFSSVKGINNSNINNIIIKKVKNLWPNSYQVYTDASNLDIDVGFVFLSLLLIFPLCFNFSLIRSLLWLSYLLYMNVLIICKEHNSFTDRESSLWYESFKNLTVLTNIK